MESRHVREEEGGSNEELRLVDPPPPVSPASWHPRPLTPGERERLAISARRDAWSRRLVVLGLLAVVGAVGWFVYWRISLFFARHRVEELLHQAAREQQTDAVAKELAGRLPFVVSHCNHLYESTPPEELLAITQGLCAVVARLPGDAEVAPLLDLTEKAAGPYATAVEIVRQRASRGWLIERSCARREGVRRFAVAALRPSFPLGELTADEAARLAERSSVDEKRRLCDEVYDAAHRRLEARWTGRYQLRIAAAWKNPGRTPTQHPWASQAPPLQVACEDRTWRVKLCGQEWSGPVEKLRTLSVICPFRSLDDPGLAKTPFRILRDAHLSVSFLFPLPQGEGAGSLPFVVIVHPVPRYEDESSGTTPMDQPSTMPPGAHVLGTGIGQKLGLPAAVFRWFRPAQAGFSAFEVSLVKQP
jgi:hypothetical protein